VSLPFLVVDFVPVTDLPQHLGQLRLFGEVWRGENPALAVQWWTPYNLVYAILALPWALLPPVLAGKVGVWLLTALQVAVLHLVAARYERPVAGAVFASAFLFSGQFYWGFLNFQWGSVVFLAWLASTARPGSKPERPGRTIATHAALAVVLYLSHALWFAFGMAWLAVDAWLRRLSRREVLWRALGVAPMALVAGAFCFLRSSWFATVPEYTTGLGERLLPRSILFSGLGGLRHPVDVLIVVGAIAWIVLALAAARLRREGGADRRLAVLALLLVAAYVLLPDKFSNTMRFNTRWLPYALMVGLLAVGELPFWRPLRRTLAMLALSSLMVVTMAFWATFEHQELSGLEASLEALPSEQRVIGLSFVPDSPRITGRPFLQLFSWAYAVRGGELNFSFAYFPPSLVVYRGTSHVHWTWGLEWFPKTVRRSDFRQFDFALVGGDEAAHRRMAALPELEGVVDDGTWRLYRVVRPSPR
jgi:hypothetical protein